MRLLAVDPASGTLGDERGQTPLSLLFDDYAKEIMEALDDCDDAKNTDGSEGTSVGATAH